MLRRRTNDNVGLIEVVEHIQGHSNGRSSVAIGSSRKAVSDREPLASTVAMRARTAGRWSVRGLASSIRSIVPSSGSRCPADRVARFLLGVLAVYQQGELVTIVSVTVAAGRVTRLDLVRAPGKLPRLAR
jgi:hypothetical protein